MGAEGEAMERGSSDVEFSGEIYGGATAYTPCVSTGVQPIDRKHLARYTQGDRALEIEVLGLFLEQLPKSVDALRLALSDQDWLRAAHTIKGSSRCVGAWRLARMGEQAERLGGITNRRARIEAVLRIEEAAEEARAFIVELTSSP